MSVNLKVTLGTVNYLDWLHITASKVSTPAAIQYETWLDVPLINYNFIIPNLDPEIYYVRYYDSPDNVSLGTLVLELVVNALTNETLFERRFYRVNGAQPQDPADTDTVITDPYLIDKVVYGVFKEGFRYLIPFSEWTFNDITGEVALLLPPPPFNSGEVWTIEIKYLIGASSTGGSGANGLYNGFVYTSGLDFTLSSGDAGKCVRVEGATTKQRIHLPSLATVPDDKGYYFDNAYGSDVIQGRLMVNGTDRIRYGGFMLPSGITLFDEFWVSKGEHFLLVKFHDSSSDTDYWELRTDYKGTWVGERIFCTYYMPGTIIEDFEMLVDGDEYPRLFWWLKNVIPAGWKNITTNVVSSPTFVQDKAGMFTVDVDTSVRMFRMPSARALTEKGMKTPLALNTDTTRPIDLPGGYQAESVGNFTAQILIPREATSTGAGGTPGYGAFASGNENYEPSGIVVDNAQVNTGKKNITDNIGGFYARRI